jgi:O-acetyl-ADP-ribose deacetylase (regulator of RNase III)
MMYDEKLTYLINYLLAENPQYKNMPIPTDESKQFRLFRSLVNVRPAMPISSDFLHVQDEFLQSEIARNGITGISDLQAISDGIYLWKGDITTLKCGAIVNAANSGLTGCYSPCHACIDNAIHTFAGVQLRLECAEIIRNQGYEEPTGQAKITSAYNLPCSHVIHTVGPIVQGNLTDTHCRLLESCYKSCLDIAVRNSIESIAFCCISTGVFGFPQDKAAEIAVRTVQEFKRDNKIEVIFNVFKQDDYEIYRRLLG